MSRTAVSVALSLALHGAVGLVAIALLPGSGILPDLVFDLTLTDEPEAAPAGSPSALSGPPRAAASGSPAPRAATSGPRAARAATITGAPARGVASSPRSVSEPPASTPAAHDLTRAPTEPPPRVPAAPSATPADNAPATAVAPSPDAIPVPDRAAGAPASPSTGGDRNASAPALGSESARVGSGGGVGPLSGGGGSETAAGSGTAARSGSAAGSTTGGGQTAAIGGGREDGGAEYAAYLTGLRQRIQASLRYPPAARRRGLEGTVHVEIVITAAGAVGPVAVVRSSSHALLDQAAVEAVRSLAPRPFPRDVPPRTLRVRLPVVFQLQ